MLGNEALAIREQARNKQGLHLEAVPLYIENTEKFKRKLKHLFFIPPKGLLFAKIVYLCRRFLCFVLAEGNRGVFPHAGLQVLSHPCRVGLWEISRIPVWGGFKNRYLLKGVYLTFLFLTYRNLANFKSSLEQ